MADQSEWLNLRTRRLLMRRNAQQKSQWEKWKETKNNDGIMVSWSKTNSAKEVPPQHG